MLPPERYGDPEDPIGGILFWPPDPWILLNHPDIESWTRLAAQLTGTEQLDRKTSIAVGPPLCQQSITALIESV